MHAKWLYVEVILNLWYTSCTISIKNPFNVNWLFDSTQWIYVCYVCLFIFCTVSELNRWLRKIISISTLVMILYFDWFCLLRLIQAWLSAVRLYKFSSLFSSFHTVSYKLELLSDSKVNNWVKTITLPVLVERRSQDRFKVRYFRWFTFLALCDSAVSISTPSAESIVNYPKSFEWIVKEISYLSIADNDQNQVGVSWFVT